MPNAIAKASTGANADAAPKEAAEGVPLTDEQRAAREEFNLNEDAVSNFELWSWYGYDWANSVYSSVVIGIFLPLVLFYMAEAFACPFTYYPVQVASEPLKNQSNWEGHTGNWAFEISRWDGHQNASTTCSMLKDSSLDVYGSPTNGLYYWPVYMQTYMNPNLDQFFEEDFKYTTDGDLVEDEDYECADTGDLGFGLVRNVTFFGVSASDLNDGLEDLSDDCDMNGSGSYEDPVAGQGVVRIVVEDDTQWDGGEYIVTLTASSNEYMMNTTNGKIVAYTLEDTNVLKLTLHPTMWSLGSTTLSFTVTSATADSTKSANFSFTVVRIWFRSCPYRVPYLGLSVRPLTFSSVTLSFAVIGQALLFISVSSFGDFGPFRKLLLCYFSLLGSVCVMFIIACDEPAMYGTAGLLTIFSNIFFGGSYVMYNAYLPYLSRSHPNFLEAKFEYKNIKSGAATGVGAASKKLLSSYHDTQDMISAEGYFWGYVSGAFCCMLSIGMVMMIPTLYGIKLVIFLMGLWWFIFAIPMFFFLKTRPGPAFPDDIRKSPWHALSFSWRRIAASLYSTRHIPETRKFCLAYFFFSDGYNTIAAVSILFAMDVLGMTTTELTIVATEAPLFGAVGMKVARWWQLSRKRSSKTMLVNTLMILTFIPCYGFFGYLRDSGLWPDCPIGLVQKNEMFFLAIIFGSTLGPVQSYARTFFTDLIPPGQESEYFGVFEISDRGSSWMGPLVCGALYEALGSYRHAMFYLLLVNTIGLVIVMRVDEVKGSDDCRRKEVLVRMAGDRKGFGIEKAGAPPSARKMVGLKSKVTGMSSTGSMMSSTGSSVESQEKSSFKVFGKNNKIKQEPGFGGATIVEQDDDPAPTNGAIQFDNATVIEQEDPP